MDFLIGIHDFFYAKMGMAFYYALGFIAVIGALLALDPSRLRTLAPAARGGRPVRDGLMYVWRNRRIRLVFIVMAIVSTFGFNYTVALPLLADDRGAQIADRHRAHTPASRAEDPPASDAPLSPDHEEQGAPRHHQEPRQADEPCDLRTRAGKSRLRGADQQRATFEVLQRPVQGHFTRLDAVNVGQADLGVGLR